MLKLRDGIAGRKLILEDVDWQTYQRLLRALDERRIRLTYDQGSLEIMTLSFNHEKIKHLLGLLVVTLAVGLDQAIAGGGSVTMKRRRQSRGLEPDECFWIQNEASMRGKEHFDLRHDPPPDLALEIAISHSSLNRMSIYAALRVPEVWRWRSNTLQVHLLDAEEKYRQSKSSKAFPSFPPAKLAFFLEVAAKEGEAKMVQTFQVWVRKNLKKG